MRSVSHTTLSRHQEFERAASEFSIEALSGGPVADLMTDCLRETGRLRQRSSPLRPLFMLWFTLCRSLYPADSINALGKRLIWALRGRFPQLDGQSVTDGGLCRARDRIGVRPLARLLRRLGECSPECPRFHGHRVLALDGSRLDFPDTPTNRSHFGRPRNQSGYGPWPQAHLLLLLDLGPRVPLDARVAPHHCSEQVAARGLLSSLKEGDLLLLDRGFYGVRFLDAVEHEKAFFLARVPNHVKFHRLGDPTRQGTVVEYSARMTGRQVLPTGRSRVLKREVRVLELLLPGFRPLRFVTNLLDVPAAELVELYRKREDIEQAFDEMKTVLCHRPPGAPATTLRAKTPARVVQEAFALLVTYSLLRRTMAAAAAKTGRAPTDLGFTDSLRAIAQTALVMVAANACNLTAIYEQMLKDIAANVLRRPVAPRSYPRVIRRWKGKYPWKRTPEKAA